MLGYNASDALITDSVSAEDIDTSVLDSYHQRNCSQTYSYLECNVTIPDTSIPALCPSSDADLIQCSASGGYNYTFLKTNNSQPPTLNVSYAEIQYFWASQSGFT